ncbi:hypothetical protein LSTR_LSTR013285 [Laodelphax striatellus]|uniref:Mediator of RNA polymerase II transcription subunit 21 n=1 Tax=Laodelphax striatellus TaxID=195883 RepID=A0A482X5L4_LAOST|nr:hypothetical protein LSTR_LSTR013285 [Laodelphax striatellus]
MADRLTQLQDLINQQAEYFCNSIGILQQFSTPSKFSGFDRSGGGGGGGAGGCTPSSVGGGGGGGVLANQNNQNQANQQLQTNQASNQDDYATLFATLIARTAKDIDVIIESLPNDDSSTELQIASLRLLEQENQEAAERLEEVVRRGEVLLEQVQAALADIAQSQLEMQQLTTKQLVDRGAAAPATATASNP